MINFWIKIYLLYIKKNSKIFNNLKQWILKNTVNIKIKFKKISIFINEKIK